MAAGTQTPGGTTVPWVTWSEDNGSGIHQIFVSRLVGDHFELMNDGQPISTVVNDSTRPDITFSRHTPYVSWIENVNGTLKTFVGHFEGNALQARHDRRRGRRRHPLADLVELHRDAVQRRR